MSKETRDAIRERMKNPDNIVTLKDNSECFLIRRSTLIEILDDADRAESREG